MSDKDFVELSFRFRPKRNTPDGLLVRVKKTILRCFNRSNSSGKALKWLFDRSKISKESARAKISEGN